MRQSAVIQRNWQSLIRPEKLEVEPGADPARVGPALGEELRAIARWLALDDIVVVPARPALDLGV